jgi:accessory secretory protein Asp1
MNNLIPDWPIQATTMEGDAIVNLARMFQDNDRAVQLFLLTETPGLRYQLHHNHLMDVAWWSVFDAIQGITLKSGLPLTLNDLTWPKGAPIRFVYGIYRTIVFQGDKQIASVYFHRDGFVWRVVWSDVAGKCVDQYDDRGFLSRRQWQDQDNQPFKTVWFDERGNVVLTQTDQIQVAGAVASRFRQATYPQLADVVIEYAAAYLEEQDVTALVAPYTTALRPLVDRLAVHYPTYGIVTESDLG